MITCPACFAREVEPVPMHKDRSTGELYCTKCTYIAADEKTACDFLDAFIFHRYGIRRQEPLPEKKP